MLLFSFILQQIEQYFKACFAKILFALILFNMSKYKAFTLIELLVTVTIIGILSSIAIYGLTTIRQKATDTSTLSKLQDTQLSLAAYKSVTGKYPDSLSALVPLRSSTTSPKRC
jgi:prepilin-type N-terminal cleavage/methylation domain-containing protein